MSLSLYRNVLVSIVAFIVLQADSKVLQSSDFEDKDIPYLLNWNENGASNVEEDQGAWSAAEQLKPGVDPSFQKKDTFDNSKEAEDRAFEKRKVFSDERNVESLRELEEFRLLQQDQPVGSQNIPFNASQVPEYVPERNIVQQPKQMQIPQIPFVYDSDDDHINDGRNCGTPVKRPGEEPSLTNLDDQPDKNREQSRSPTIIPLNNALNSKGVTISIMVPYLDLSQNCKPSSGPQLQHPLQQSRQPLIGTRLDKGGRNKGKLKDKKERPFGKCAKKAEQNDQNRIVSFSDDLSQKSYFDFRDPDGPYQGSRFATETPLPTKDNHVRFKEPQKNRASVNSPFRNYTHEEPEMTNGGLDQWNVLDKILELNLRKREALENLKNEDDADYFDDHVVRNKRLLFFRRKSKHSHRSLNDSQGFATAVPPLTTLKGIGKKKLSSTPPSNSLNNKKTKSDGKKTKHFRLWGEKTVPESSNRSATAPASVNVDEASKEDNLMGQHHPSNNRVSSDQQDIGIGGIQPNLRLLTPG